MRILDEGVGNRDPLLLSSTQCYTAFPHHPLVLFREPGYIPRYTCLTSAIFHACHRSLLQSETDIVLDSVAKQEYILGHITDLLSENVQVNFVYCYPNQFNYP